jgi:hypothetical protein
MKIKDIDNIIIETISQKIKSELVKESVDKYIVKSHDGTPMETFDTEEEAKNHVEKSKEKLLIDKKTYESYDAMLEDLDEYNDKLEENINESMKNKTNKVTGYLKNESVLVLAKLAKNKKNDAAVDLLMIAESCQGNVPLSDVITVLNYHNLNDLKKKITLKEDFSKYDTFSSKLGKQKDPFAHLSDDEYDRVMSKYDDTRSLDDEGYFSEKDLYDAGSPIRMYKSDTLNPVQSTKKKKLDLEPDNYDDDNDDFDDAITSNMYEPDEPEDTVWTKPAKEEEPTPEDIDNSGTDYDMNIEKFYDDEDDTEEIYELSGMDELSETDEFSEMEGDMSEFDQLEELDTEWGDGMSEMDLEMSEEGMNYEGEYGEMKTTCDECGSMLNEEGMCSECSMKMNESKKRKIRLTESQLTQLIAKIVNESVPGLSVTEKNRKTSGSDSKKHMKDVESKMKKTLKFDGNDNPKFPKQIGKGEKVARQNSKDEDKIMSTYRGGGMEDLKYDTEPSKSFNDRVEKSLKGHSTMGNSQDSPNVVKSDLGEKIHQKAKNKKETLEKEFNVSWGHSWKEPEKVNVVKESKTETKNVLNEEIKRMKDMAMYNKKTQ